MASLPIICKIIVSIFAKGISEACNFFVVCVVATPEGGGFICDFYP